MNMLKKGPDLKLPELKVPGFLLDVYYDLRERHLLPLVAILIVAIVALPIALGGGSSDSESAESAVAMPSAAVPTSGLVVAKAAPGLRDYRRRLNDRAPRDPFVQQYTSAGGGKATSTDESSAGDASSSGAESAAPSEPVSSEPSSPPEAPSSIPVGEDGKPADMELTYFSFVIDVRVVPVAESGQSKGKPTVRRDLPELTMLPSRDTPALTYISVSKDEKKVLMLVSDNVRGLFGDGVCVVGSDSCQLLALEPGIPETVVYGAEERAYRIEIIKLHAVTTDSLDKAPLGKQKQKGEDSKKSGSGA